MTLGLPLPRFVVLQSCSPNNKNKFLRYATEEGDLNDAIACNGDSATKSNAKFEVEQATDDVAFDKPMVHIRSCYNNKYLRPSSSNDQRHHHCIVAAAEKPEEDQKSQWSSTLFEPDFSPDDPNTIRLLHVQSGLYLRWSDDICTLAGSPIQNSNVDEAMFMFKVNSWESLVILPKYVAFKGDNGLYLGVRRVNNIDSPCLQFAVSDEADDRSVKNQIIPTPDGRSVWIKNVHSGSFWKRDDYNWICPISKESSSSPPEDAMLFKVIKIKDNVVALLNLANNHFCKRYTVKAATSCLRAMDSTVTEFAQLEATELVSSRSIYNVDFRLDHARIIHSEEARRIVASATTINNTANPKTKNLRLTFDDTRSMTWTNSSSLRLPKKVRIESEVAHIATGPEVVVMSGEFGGSTYDWDETTTRTWRVKRVHKVVVPPMRKVTVRLWETVGRCEVPFSYVQRDVLGNGEVESYVRDDGFYSGTNAYDFEYETLEESLV